MKKKTETVETNDGHKINVKNHNSKGDVFTDEVFKELKEDFREMSVYEAMADIKVPTEQYKDKYGKIYKEDNEESNENNQSKSGSHKQTIRCDYCDHEADKVIELAQHMVEQHPEVEEV